MPKSLLLLQAVTTVRLAVCFRELEKLRTLKQFDAKYFVTVGRERERERV